MLESLLLSYDEVYILTRFGIESSSLSSESNSGIELSLSYNTSSPLKEPELNSPSTALG